ncbi:MAG: hypothetical protein AAGF83_21010 [Cyanobacteria bacterium P01_G01_bin.67]
MFEYCSVTYACVGRGWTQELYWIRINGNKIMEWRTKQWTDYLNYMAQEKWELISTHPLEQDGSDSVAVAYFKRLV